MPVYFSNPDLLWANEFPVPRLGQGAFAACLEMLHQKVRPPLEAAELRHAFSTHWSDPGMSSDA